MRHTPQQLEEILSTSANEASKLGVEWAVKNGQLLSVKDRKNDYLAALTKKAEGSSKAMREINARTSDEWTEFRDSLIAAKQEESMLKVKYTAKRNWDTARSLLSAMNAERRTNT